MTATTPYTPFSQRTGLAPLPPQLKLGEVSSELRRLIWYYLSLEFDRETTFNLRNILVFNENWTRLTKDLHVIFFKEPIDRYSYSASTNIQRLRSIVDSAGYGTLFDLVEFLIRHQLCSTELKKELTSAFISARAAYRIVDNECIVAIGTEEQAVTVERAIEETGLRDAAPARKHLISAGLALRDSDWPGCIRESIHAVESVAVQLAPGTDTLGDALKALEKRRYIHGGLKAAFSSLYGYSSDEKGIRHALVIEDEAHVDEADALFMLGACASFVSYLLAHSN